tara:strand:+ start:6846 stop:8285 length:1440 start_codon:yes stop_codon:yes gene_type:complete
MKKVKLKKFVEFSESILPNEAKYLLKIQHLKDPEKKEILNLLLQNSLAENNAKEFSISIDKRKYSYIKNWAETKLAAIDVDVTMVWLIDLKKKILTDAISSEDEKLFLKYIIHYKKIDFNFKNLYELAKEYKPYLLVRMRYKDHTTLADFINKYKDHYQKAKEIEGKLYEATTEITNQYTLNNTETKFWEKWLYKVFKTKNIDGRNRYQAFILLAFMYTNYNQTEKLKVLFDLIDMYFSEGELYSKRLLCNYYASRVLMHSKLNELNKAEYFAYLSVKQQNNDTLMYLNNFAAILLKRNKITEASNLLKAHENLFNNSHNYHQKIGFISYQIRVLGETENPKLAENKAKNFLSKYKNEIFEQRWHHFFTSYLTVLITQEKYSEILKLANKYNLVSKEIERKKKQNYIPNISWSISLSKYMEGIINSKKLLAELKEGLKDVDITVNQQPLMIQVINKLSKNLPEAFLKLKSHILKMDLNH